MSILDDSWYVHQTLILGGCLIALGMLDLKKKYPSNGHDQSKEEEFAKIIEVSEAYMGIFEYL